MTVTEEQEKKKKKDPDSRWDGDDDQFPKIPKKANTQIAHWKVCQLKVEKTERVSPRLQNFLSAKDIILNRISRQSFWPKIAKFSIVILNEWWFSPMCIQMDSFNLL